MTTKTEEKKPSKKPDTVESPSSVYFVSLGCPKNLVDSQVMLGLLKSNKFTIAEDPAAADTVIVNTCSFKIGRAHV